MTTGSLALVIDDNDDTREMYAVALQLEGFAVEQARDGREGIRKALASQPDIIVTDLAMPILDGWETIRCLKDDDRTRRIPVIACSGQIPERIRDCAADVILPKPCPIDLLMAEIRRLLSRDAVA